MGGVQGFLCFLADFIRNGAGNAGAVIDDRKGDPGSDRVLPGGIVGGGAAPDAEGDGQVWESFLQLLGKHPVKDDLAGIVR